MDEAHLNLLRAWVTKSKHDLVAAQTLGEKGAPLDTAIYHCQQAAEKAVKAFLVFHGTTPEKTHDIRKLSVEASAIEPRFEEIISMAAGLTPYAWEFRYPGDLAETDPTREEFNEALQHAQTIYDFVLNLLPDEARPK